MHDRALYFSQLSIGTKGERDLEHLHQAAEADFKINDLFEKPHDFVVTPRDTTGWPFTRAKLGKLYFEVSCYSHQHYIINISLIDNENKQLSPFFYYSNESSKAHVDFHDLLPLSLNMIGRSFPTIYYIDEFRSKPSVVQAAHIVRAYITKLMEGESLTPSEEADIQKLYRQFFITDNEPSGKALAYAKLLDCKNRDATFFSDYSDDPWHNVNPRSLFEVVSLILSYVTSPQYGPRVENREVNGTKYVIKEYWNKRYNLDNPAPLQSFRQQFDETLRVIADYHYETHRKNGKVLSDSMLSQITEAARDEINKYEIEKNKILTLLHQGARCDTSPFRRLPNEVILKIAELSVGPISSPEDRMLANAKKCLDYLHATLNKELKEDVITRFFKNFWGTKEHKLRACEKLKNITDSDNATFKALQDEVEKILGAEGKNPTYRSENKNHDIDPEKVLHSKLSTRTKDILEAIRDDDANKLNDLADRISAENHLQNTIK